ncbi:MAG: fasciclin domain-containing protein [Phormidesmis sp.]
MHVNPRFIKSFMVGLVASSAGAFIALPSAAQEAPTLSGLLETLPSESRLGSTDTDSLSAPVADEPVEEMPVAEEPVEEMPVADEPMEAESIEATEPMEEEAIEATEPTEEETVEAAEPELDTASYTIAELTGNSDSFDTLAAALDAADLAETLGSEGPYTVFAPTDEAFADLPAGSVEQLLLPENKDLLVQILSYHVVPGAVLSTDLETGSVTTVEGSDLAVAVDETVTINNANVLLADIEASNGVIHVIDRVMLPPAPEANADLDAAEPVQ